MGAAHAYAADDLGLSMYSDPPNVEVSIREFQEMTLDRLKLLQSLDRICGFETHLGSISEIFPKIKKDLYDAKLILAYPSGKNESYFADEKVDYVRRDAISHFAMRLAFCKTRETREWLVRQEQRLFVLRYEFLSSEAKEDFMKASGVPCQKFVHTEGGMTLHDLQRTTCGAKIWSEGANRGGPPSFDVNFYEMPFSEVHPSLIAARKVVVQRGKAFVPSSALKLILAKNFKDSLNTGLEIAFHGMSNALSDPRVGDFLRALQEHGLQLLVAPKSNLEDPGEKLSLESIEEILVRSFPPCMRRLIEKQREMKKHLKHAGRMQLRPFLKECGFTFEESVRWWRTELMRDPEIDGTSFEKNYLYDMEHAYGKKGHLQGQNCCGCPKIINLPGEAAGQVHGCPFKQLDMPMLKQQLHRWRIPEATMIETEKLINNGKHYQLACIEYFKAKHPAKQPGEEEGNGVGNSPNDYYSESCRYHMKKSEKKGDVGSPKKTH